MYIHFENTAESQKLAETQHLDALLTLPVRAEKYSELVPWLKDSNKHSTMRA